MIIMGALIEGQPCELAFALKRKFIRGVLAKAFGHLASSRRGNLNFVIAIHLEV